MIGVLAFLALGLTVRVGTRPVGDPDIWWHLKTGQYVLNGGQFSGPDPWVPFATRPFVLTQWLPEVVAQKAYELAGLPGVSGIVLSKAERPDDIARLVHAGASAVLPLIESALGFHHALDYLKWVKLIYWS